MTKEHHANGRICGHCNLEVAIRNPSGFCDHLYYPENCDLFLANSSQGKEQRRRTAEAKACQGLRTAALEAGVVGKLLGLLKKTMMHLDSGDYDGNEYQYDLYCECKEVITLAQGGES